MGLIRTSCSSCPCVAWKRAALHVTSFRTKLEVLGAVLHPAVHELDVLSPHTALDRWRHLV